LRQAPDTPGLGGKPGARRAQQTAVRVFADQARGDVDQRRDEQIGRRLWMQSPAPVGAMGRREMLRDQATPFGRYTSAGGDVEDDHLRGDDRAPDDFALPAAV